MAMSDASDLYVPQAARSRERRNNIAVIKVSGNKKKSLEMLAENAERMSRAMPAKRGTSKSALEKTDGQNDLNSPKRLAKESVNAKKEGPDIRGPNVKTEGLDVRKDNPDAKKDALEIDASEVPASEGRNASEVPASKVGPHARLESSPRRDAPANKSSTASTAQASGNQEPRSPGVMAQPSPQSGQSTLANEQSSRSKAAENSGKASNQPDKVSQSSTSDASHANESVKQISRI